MPNPWEMNWGGEAKPASEATSESKPWTRMWDKAVAEQPPGGERAALQDTGATAKVDAIKAKRTAADSADEGKGFSLSIAKATGANVGALADMVLSIPSMLAGTGADAGARIVGTLASPISGESRREIAKGGLEAREKVGGAVSALTPTVGKVMKALGYGEDYDNSDVSQGMQKLSKLIQRYGRHVEKGTGGMLLEEDVDSLLNAAMAAAGPAGVKALTRPNPRGNAVMPEKPYEAAPPVEPKPHLRSAPATMNPVDPKALTATAAGATAGLAYLMAPEEYRKLTQEGIGGAALGAFFKTHGADMAPKLAKLKDLKDVRSWIREEHPNIDLAMAQHAEGYVDIQRLEPKGKVDPISWVKASHKAVAALDVLGKDARTLAQATGDIPQERLEKYYESLGFKREDYQPYKDATYMYRAAQKGEAPLAERGAIDPELAKRMGLAAGGAAVGAELDEENPVRGAAGGLAAGALVPGAVKRLSEAPVGRSAEIGAVKPKGGMWHPEAVERLSQPLKDKLVMGADEAAREMRQKLAGEPVTPASTDAWSDRSVRNYLNRYAGTAEDPLKDIVLPSGKRWEEVTDAVITGIKAKHTGEPRGPAAVPEESWLQGVPPDEQVWHANLRNSQVANELRSYLSHVGDYLRQNVDPAKLPQYDLVRAVKETAKNDERVAREMEKAAVASTKDLPVYKDYGDGFKWVELKLPERLTEEQGKRVQKRTDLEGHLEPGAGGEGYVALGADNKPVVNSYTENWAVGKSPEEAHLAGQLAQEGNQMGHCVGGYCEGVASGESRIFSLRDAKGKSHVTVEVTLPDPRSGRGDVGHPEVYFERHATPEYKAKIGDKPVEDIVQQGRSANSYINWQRKIIQSPEYQKYFASLPQDILQIKGKQNRAPAAEYLPYVQDFVKSGKWGEVGDLENTGLHSILQPSGSEYPRNWHGDPELASLVNVSPKELGLEPGFYTEPELRSAAQAATKRNGWDGQGGFISPQAAATLGLGATGAALGAAADPEHRGAGALLGGLTGVGLANAPWKKLGKGADIALGVLSTRVGNISPPIKRRLVDFERNLLKGTHERVSAVSPFLVRLNKVPAADRGELNRALLTNDPAAVKESLQKINDPELTKNWESVRKVLIKTGIALADAGRFKLREDYFPRIVKDREGLLKTLNHELRTALEKDLQKEELAAMKARGTPLTAAESSQIINRHLLEPARTANEPGFAKSRRIEEVTAALEPFYLNPTGSLHAYLREATFDLEKMKFFGKEKIDVSRAGRKYVNTEASIGNVVQQQLAAKKLSFDQAQELEGLLRSRFVGGEKFSSKALQDARNLANIGLLGNFVSAAAQLGDPFVTVFTQGLRPTLSGVATTLAGRGLKMKDFGLVDHISEEFVTTSKTAKWLNTSFKYGAFSLADAFGKNITLNAARKNFEKMAQSFEGSKEIRRKYRDYYGKDTPQLINDLKARKLTDLTESLYFQELSNMQPISKSEMPQGYLDNPNARMFYMLKSFMLKQADLIRREGYEEIKKGNVARGLKNLTGASLALGIGGAATQEIQNWLLGKPMDDPKWSDISGNLLKTFGWSQYVIDKARQGHPIEAAANVALPPYKMFEEILRRDPRAIQYIPIIGKFLWNYSPEGKAANEKAKKAEESREITRRNSPLFGKPSESDKARIQEEKRMLREMRGVGSEDVKKKILYSDTPGRGITNSIQERAGLIERSLRNVEEADMDLSRMIEREKRMRRARRTAA